MEKASECVKSSDVTIIAINYFPLLQDSCFRKDEEAFFKGLHEFKEWLSKYPGIETYSKDALKVICMGFLKS